MKLKIYFCIRDDPYIDIIFQSPAKLFHTLSATCHVCALSPSCNLHKAISLVNEICICATCSAKTFAFVSVMCDKLENQAFYANANAHRPPPGGDAYSSSNNNVLLA